MLRVKADGTQIFEPLAQFNGSMFVPLPIDPGPESDQLFILLFGTGIRNNSGLSAVSAQIGGAVSEVLYAGTQGDFAGLDQVNLRLPRSLAGRGVVDITLTVDGKQANKVQINVK